jgi:hypothetical protein
VQQLGLIYIGHKLPPEPAQTSNVAELPVFSHLLRSSWVLSRIEEAVEKNDTLEEEGGLSRIKGAI